MSVEMMTAVMFGSILVVLMTGIPIGFGLGCLAVVFAWINFGPAMLGMITTTAIGSMLTIVLIAVPMFIFMGEMLEHSGIAEALYVMMYRWFGPVRGGLAMGTVLICTIFAAMAGVSAAATVTMSVIALPAMFKRGYDKHLAMGCIMAGGALGILIPPSVTMVVYAFWATESVGRLFFGGVFPGLLLSLMYVTYIGVMCYLKPDIGPALPPEERVGWKEKFISLRGVILPIILIMVVMGSILMGVATPTEAAAVGAGGATLCAAIYRKLNWKMVSKSSQATLKHTCMIMFITMGASAFASVYEAIGGVEVVKGLMEGLAVNRWVVIVIIQVIYLALGCFLDPIGIIMITVPIFVPVIMELGFDPVWFGVLFIVNMEAGFLTPPFGINLFYMRACTPADITMVDIYRSVIPWVVMQVIGLIVCMIFPQIVLWFPNLIFGVPVTG
ncbi:MAG: TRAP transporter large permease subunit [Dehalococcoidales bacterium]|nr:TRAP transporter large permease subunit [Dehalococcoidales bacterium]